MARRLRTVDTQATWVAPDGPMETALARGVEMVLEKGEAVSRG